MKNLNYTSLLKTTFAFAFLTFLSVVAHAQAVIRVATVNPNADEITLTNLGNASQDVGSYWLCLGPGSYVQVSDATSDPTNLDSGDSVTVNYDIDPVADGFSLFTTNNFNSSDPNDLIDYIQWGAGNQARVGQAVTAGRWDNANNFVSGNAPYVFTGGATDFGSTFWGEGSDIIRILSVDTDTDEILLSNFGVTTVDVGTYWLCLGPGTYVQVTDAATGNTNLAPGDDVVVNYDVDPVADGFSLFSVNDFGSSDPNILVDYIQWGAANQARVGQAVTAGRWDDVNNFVALGSPYNFIGTATDFGSNFWEPTLGLDDFAEADFSVYPNPVADQLNIRLQNTSRSNVEVVIYDLSGRNVFSQSIPVQSNTVLNVSELYSGIYMVTLMDGADVLASRRLIKK